MKQVLYLHIGLPKTGTSFLQSKVFPNINGLKNIERENILTGNPLFDEFYMYFLNANYLAIRQRAPQFESLILSHESESKKHFIFSNESFSSGFIDPRLSHFRDGKNSHFMTQDMETLFRNIKVFNECSKEIIIKPLIILRNQNSLIHSWYAQKHHRFIERPGMKTFEEYLDRLLGDDFYAIGGQVYDFANLFHNLDKYLPRENYFIGSFHEILERKKLDSLVNFLGIYDESESLENLLGQPKVNARAKSGSKRVASTSKHNVVIRKLHQLKKSLIPNKSFGLKKVIKVNEVILEQTEAQKDRIDQFFKSKNEAFLTEYNLPKDFLD
jgi:hypothetical protein